MLKKFKTAQLIFIALMATLLLIINLSLGGWIIAITGIPMINMVVTGISFGIFIMIMIKTLPKFGTLTLFMLIYAVLELPTNLGGAPGFWPKIPINVISALIGDMLLFAVKYRRGWLYPTFYILIIANTLTFIFFMNIMGVPGWEKILGMLWFLFPIYFVLGTIGMFIGELIVKRIERKNFYVLIKD